MSPPDYDFDSAEDSNVSRAVSAMSEFVGMMDSGTLGLLPSEHAVRMADDIASFPPLAGMMMGLDTDRAMSMSPHDAYSAVMSLHRADVTSRAARADADHRKAVHDDAARRRDDAVYASLGLTESDIGRMEYERSVGNDSAYRTALKNLYYT